MESRRTPVFSVFISLSFLISVVSAFSPLDHYLIDCGSAATVDVDHRRFTGDSSDLGTRYLSAAGSISLRESTPSVDSSPLYHTARAFVRPSRYVFKVRDKGTHLVRLHFHRFDSSHLKICHVQFHVSANGYVLLYNFTAENLQSPVIKDYMIWVDVDELVITFTPSKKSKTAFVNAIEVISAPKDLIADVAFSVGPEKVEQINGLMETALETVHRVSVGGPKVTPFNDSLWRSWIPDDEFLKLSEGSSRIYFGGRINYQPGGATREVCPDNVYNTARLISSSDDSIPKLNIMWGFPVIGGYKYLVRLHFCDIASVSIGTIHFNVYVNGKLAYYNLYLSEVTNWVLASPFYADFVVDGDSSGSLCISIGPSNVSMSHSIDGILNGIEIMKMNNEMGSLDGEVCAGSILKSWHGSNKGSLVPLIAAVCLLVIASMVVHRRRAWFRDAVAWSPLPTDISEVNLKTSMPSLGKV